MYPNAGHHPNDGDWEGSEIPGRRGNPSWSHGSGVRLAPVPSTSNCSRPMAPQITYVSQLTAALSDHHNDRGNVQVHLPPTFTIPSHHPRPNDPLLMRTAAPQPTLANSLPLPVPSGPDDPGAMQPPTQMPLQVPTFGHTSHPGNYLPSSIPSDLHPGATAPPPLTLSDSESDYRGNWPLSVPSNSHPAVMPQMRTPSPGPSLNNYRGNWHPSVPSNPYPSAMPQMRAPSFLNDYDGSLPLPPFMVPSQDLRPCDLALILPPAIMDYRHKFPPPVVAMDCISTLPPAAPDDLQPLTMLTPPPKNISRGSRKRSHDDGAWRFIEYAGQRQKIFKPTSSAPSTTPSDHLPTDSTQPRLDLPPLKYQHNLSKHEDFVLAAEYQLISHAVNICAMIESSDREVVVQAGLAHAVKGCLEKAHNIGPNSAETMKKEVQDFSQWWAATNAGSLYMQLSMPFKLIMAASKEVAFAVVERSYDLRPSIWSEIPESKWKQSKIKHLIYNATCPLKFIFKKDDNTGQWMPFEHDALLDVVIGVVRKLKYHDYVKELDNLYCTATAAIYCVLKQFSPGKLPREIDFTAHAFKFMYDLSKAHITDVIEQDEILAKRWSDVKEYTLCRLADILVRVVVAESRSS